VTLFEELMNDTIDLVKPDGRRIDGIKAVVQPAEIITLDTALEAGEGDVIERRQEDGEVERYRVTRAAVEPAQGAVPAFGRILVRKEEAAGPAAETRVVYGVAGPEVQIRLFSSEAQQVITHLPSDDFFAHLQYAAAGIADEEEKGRLLAALDGLRHAYGGPDIALRASEFAALAVGHRKVYGRYLAGIGQLLAM
jgi:hypothetical protein